MKKRSALALLLSCLFVLCAWAGGNPEFVRFPAGYETSFTHYTTMNRVGQPMLARMYANAVAVASYQSGKPAGPGSIMIMEIWKPKMDAKKRPVTGPDGLFQAGSLAAVAVMERHGEWDGSFPENQRAGGWGFALYNPDGSSKENTLACAQCHQPLAQQDHLFTQQKLLAFVQGR